MSKIKSQHYRANFYYRQDDDQIEQNIEDVYPKKGNNYYDYLSEFLNNIKRDQLCEITRITLLSKR